MLNEIDGSEDDSVKYLEPDNVTLSDIEKDIIDKSDIIIQLGIPEDQKLSLLKFLWKTAYADGRLDIDEERLVRRVADLINIKDIEVLKLRNISKN